MAHILLEHSRRGSGQAGHFFTDDTMDTMTTPTLKPCPHCGGTRCRTDLGYGLCPDCMMLGPDCDTEEEAARAWNALPRPSEVAALRARIAELEAAAQPAQPPGDLHWLLATADHVDADDPEWPVYYGTRDGRRWSAWSSDVAEAWCKHYGWTPDKRDTDPAP